jgi:NAD(P)-dependent dehydrogenase (short-subunit alcohol dehydrogenase family)
MSQEAEGPRGARALPGRRVLITGATSGIGRELARQLGLRGCRIAVTGRRSGLLQETAALVESGGGECLSLAGCVTDAPTVKEHYAAIREAWGGLDWAILNAGVGESGSARHFTADHYHRVFATNVGGVINWLEAVLPYMVAQGRGTVAGICSLAAWRGLPNSGAYSASKAALLTLLESTRVDLRGTGVGVVCVCPGFIRSDPDDPGQSGRPFLLELECGVRHILRAIERGKPMVAFPWQLSCLVRGVAAHLPPGLYDWVASRAFPTDVAEAPGATDP